MALVCSENNIRGWIGVIFFLQHCETGVFYVLHSCKRSSVNHSASNNFAWKPKTLLDPKLNKDIS